MQWTPSHTTLGWASQVQLALCTDGQKSLESNVCEASDNFLNTQVCQEKFMNLQSLKQHYTWRHKELKFPIAKYEGPGLLELSTEISSSSIQPTVFPQNGESILSTALPSECVCSMSHSVPPTW